MSKQENTNIKIYIKNAKIKSDHIYKICDCFIKDYTAIQTAKETGFSRQTINHYYKIIRTRIMTQMNMEQYKNILSVLEQKDIEIKHLNIYNKNVFIIESYKGVFILDNQFFLPNKLFQFIEENIKNTLINHKKANSVRILHNKEKNSYLTLGYFKSFNDFELFFNSRLRKFRGINKNNFQTHLNESLYRYNSKTSDIHKEIINYFK